MNIERADHHRVLAALRSALDDTTALERAALLQGCVQIVYDHVKFGSPEGGGLDGRDGPERTGLAEILDAAKNYLDHLNRHGLPPNIE